MTRRSIFTALATASALSSTPRQTPAAAWFTARRVAQWDATSYTLDTEVRFQPALVATIEATVNPDVWQVGLINSWGILLSLADINRLQAMLDGQ